MKLVSVNIASFGKLKNFRYSFNDGINVLAQHNGFGKTTLANFIRAMLYGFDYKRFTRGGESTSDAAIWATWNSTDKIGGSMVVSHGGATYQIERYFGLTAKSETLQVTNLQTGRALDVTNVGEYFLGLTAESYDRSAYLPQESVKICATENFDSRLAGLVQNAENYDDVQNKLRKYRKNLKYERGDGGLISDLEHRKLQLQRQLADGEQAARREKEIDRRMGQIAQERQRCKAAAQAANEKISALQTNLAQYNFAEENVNRQKLQQLQSNLARCSELEQDKLACDALAEKIAETPEITKKQRGVLLPLLIAGICLVAAGIGLCFWLLAVGICVAVVGVALSVVSFFVKPSLVTLQSGDKDVYITEYFHIAEKYFYCVNMDYNEVQKTMWQTYNKYVGDKREYEALLQTVDKVSVDVDLEDKLRRAQLELDVVRQKQEALSREEGSLVAERQSLRCDTTTVREEISETEQKLEEAKRKYHIADLTSRLLTQAKENLSVGYLPQLCQRCEYYLNGITAENYRLVMDRDFAIKLQTNSVTKPLDYFSRGIREITLLCFRIALSEMLYDGHIPFIIIDDTFVNFDEQNFQRATMLLKQLKNTQIVYFTCLNRLGALK